MEKPGSGEVCCLPRVTQGHGGADTNSVGLTQGHLLARACRAMACLVELSTPVLSAPVRTPIPHPAIRHLLQRVPSRPRRSHKGSSPLVLFWIHSECFQVRQQNAWPAVSETNRVSLDPGVDGAGLGLEPPARTQPPFVFAFLHPQPRTGPVASCQPEGWFPSQRDVP